MVNYCACRSQLASTIGNTNKTNEGLFEAPMFAVTLVVDVDVNTVAGGVVGVGENDNRVLVVPLAAKNPLVLNLKSPVVPVCVALYAE